MPQQIGAIRIPGVSFASATVLFGLRVHEAAGPLSGPDSQAHIQSRIWKERRVERLQEFVLAFQLRTLAAAFKKQQWHF